MIRYMHFLFLRERNANNTTRSVSASACPLAQAKATAHAGGARRAPQARLEPAGCGMLLPAIRNSPILGGNNCRTLTPAAKEPINWMSHRAQVSKNKIQMRETTPACTTVPTNGRSRSGSVPIDLVAQHRGAAAHTTRFRVEHNVNAASRRKGAIRTYTDNPQVA